LNLCQARLKGALLAVKWELLDLALFMRKFDATQNSARIMQNKKYFFISSLLFFRFSRGG